MTRPGTNPQPCGTCGETCGYRGPEGDGAYQCATLGTRWSDNNPTGPNFIARLLGVDRATVDQWRQRGLFPSPDWPVEETGRPQWRRRTVLDWAKLTGRL